MTLAAQAVQTVIRLRAPLDLRQTLGSLLRGSGDPTMRFEPDGTVWRATRTPAGPATLRLRRHDTEVRAVAWGPGAADALDALPDLLGEDDRPELLVAHHGLVAELARRLPGMRLPRTHRPFVSLLPSILEQMVTNTVAWRG
jgi:3-methyladenine DNA glycosylase/8-oxoguanine DNA glycosylase